MGDMTDEPQPVTRTIELDIALAQTKAVQRVEVRRIRIPAGIPADAHTHNGPVFGTIVSGSVRYAIAGEDDVVLHPGDVFYEPEGVVVTHFDALDDDVEFIGVFPLGPGEDAALAYV
jgi:quercetin dioxygenase-like cupin family protein